MLFVHIILYELKNINISFSGTTLCKHFFALSCYFTQKKIKSLKKLVLFIKKYDIIKCKSL